MINPNFIAETMKDMDMRFFQVEDNYGRSVYQQFQNISLEEAIKRYRKFIDNCSTNSSFNITLYQSNERLRNGRPKEEGMTYEVLISENKEKENNRRPIDGYYGRGGGMGNVDEIAEMTYRAGTMGAIDLDRYLQSQNEITRLNMEVAQLRMDKKYMEDKHDMEMERIKREYEDKLGSDRKIEGIMGTILPHLGLGGMMSEGMAGVPINGMGDSPKERIMNAVNTLIKLDVNFPDNIERLASLAKGKPTIYQMAVKQLNDLA
tara:strand:- start:1933 stop:2718 length:786 start_codon:yes stop_codon:yes gene_type:complete